MVNEFNNEILQLNAAQAHNALFDSIKRPKQFDDWLCGKHYVNKYLPELEHAKQHMESLLLSGIDSSKIHKEKYLPKHAKAIKINMQISNNSNTKAAVNMEGERSAVGSKLKELEDTELELEVAKTTSEEAVKNKIVNEEMKSVKNNKSNKYHSQNGKADSILYEKKISKKRFTTLNALEIRDQLKNSYFHMREVDAFGDTFPPLLTPYKRPLLRYYAKDEWDNRKSEKRNKSTLDEHLLPSKCTSKHISTGKNMKTEQEVNLYMNRASDTNNSIAYFSNARNNTGPPRFTTTIRFPSKRGLH